MKKRIFIIHRWDGTPDKDWLPWVNGELEKKGYEVSVPEMPNAEEPKIEEWVPFLSNLVGEVDEDTFFIGHSIGCQTTMRYLETIYPAKIGGIIFVAPWFNLMNFEDEESKAIAKPWLETPIDLEKVKSATDNITVFMSDNDPFVPLSDKEIFESKLNAKVIVVSNKGHFTQDDGIKELPEILNLIK
ncbi:MAG: hypothetical protein ACD_7C00517G0001 [uncultured bacterium]|nr:MAG: hypothetical protein ACD_7C00517G0001 [uncultured bacterium]KKP68128.1 MAG: hypothetical protein UR66_C0008G0036 [Candidatus Moranbacteria bacterium GW2011_GWE1_35_17]KKP72264.1 MAG: hypothetical protein UR65_C0018G0014 [Candidatus Moranbacteria bacterium GW2011_GWE2_35_164]KKP84277.1 MAG: hypothetical protein UR83_C0024G0006 [Candidatus Moranbacteria bacterium GW2011_GWF2_35_54]